VIIEGTALAVAKIDLATAFAFLADPRNGRLWFTSAGLADPPEGPLRQGLTWRLEKTRETRRVLSVSMITYEPPDYFVWATQLSHLGTNHRWELRFQPGPQAGTTSITMTLRLYLGPLGWPSGLIAFARLRRTLTKRAERALERAREILEAESQARVRRGKETGARRGKWSRQRGSTRR
jgi:Polyketide cyclase / dehydrase and lipid transport